MKHIRLAVISLTLISSSLYPYYFGLDQAGIKGKDLVGFIDTVTRSNNPSYAEQIDQIKRDSARAVASVRRNAYITGCAKGLAQGFIKGARAAITHTIVAIPTALGIGYVIAKSVTAKLKKPMQSSQKQPA